MKLSLWLFLSLTLGAVFLGTHVRAEDDEEEEEVSVSEETPEATATFDDEEYVDDLSADVTTTYLLPNNLDKKLPIGQPVTLLINFINNGQEVINVTNVGAFLHSPFDFNYYIQNFTAKPVVGGIVGPLSQISLEYEYLADPKLEPLEFWMSAFVEYNAEGSDTVYRNVVFNETVSLVNTGSSWDFGMLLSSLLLVVVAVFGGYSLLTSTKKGAKAKKKLVPKTELSAADKEAAAASWETPAYKPADKSRAARRK